MSVSNAFVIDLVRYVPGRGWYDRQDFLGFISTLVSEVTLFVRDRLKVLKAVQTFDHRH